MNKRLAILSTHPIQYNAPFFRAIGQSGKVIVKVFYTWDKGVGLKHDPGFGKDIAWDIPLLEGYEFTYVKNTSKSPGSHHFWGIQNPTLIEEIKTFQPDAILVYGWSFHSHLQAMRYFKGKVPVWFRGDSTLLDYDYQSLKDIFRKNKEIRKQRAEGRRQKAKKNQNSISFLSSFLSFLKFALRRLFLTWVYKHVDKAFYVGTNNKSYFQAHGLKEEQLVWMPHAVDNEFFQRKQEKVEAEAKKWRAALGIRKDDFVVLFAGKFEPKKNPELLVRAVIEMNEEAKDQQLTTNNQQPVTSSSLHLILVGSGILESKLKTMAHGKNYIHFLPFQNQSMMPVVYRLGDMFCLPSQGPGETWGLAINEAMACGKPVIISNKVGCAEDLVTSDMIGFTFQHNSMLDLINKITILKSSETVRMGNFCKTHINNWNYKIDGIIKQFN